MTELRLWQRHHTPDLIAEVTPVPGMGTWTICTFRNPKRVAAHHGGQFHLLTEAHREADALLAAIFSHVCDTDCGAWHPVERRAEPR
jgi:hypothetical protein